MVDGSRRALQVGLLVAIVVLTALVALVGAGDIVVILRSADLFFVGTTVAFALCWLAAWGLMLRTVLDSLDIRLHAVTSFFIITGVVFANNVTPFGQVGGQPVNALIISEVSDCQYETGLAGIASFDVINVVPSLSLILVGVGFYATSAAIDSRLGTALSSAVVLVGVLVIIVGFIWRHQNKISERLPSVIASVIGRIWRDRYDAEVMESILAGRVQRFFADIERVGKNRWQLSTMFGLSLTGWLAQAVALIAAFAAVGHAVPLYVALFVTPLANLAGATPTPGGLGAIEAAYVTLLVPTTGFGAAAITAAVLVFRGATYVMPLVIGGFVNSILGIRAVR